MIFGFGMFWTFFADGFGTFGPSTLGSRPPAAASSGDLRALRGVLEEALEELGMQMWPVVTGLFQCEVKNLLKAQIRQF